jgi:hypothetical protein
MVNSRRSMSKTKIGEWFWRFLAVVMMFSVGWMVWIIYQLNPPPLVTDAAFAAAAKATARVKGAAPEKQSVQGVIVPSSGADPAAKAPEAQAAPPQAPAVAKQPPVNPEKLKLSDTIAVPDPAPNAKK